MPALVKRRFGASGKSDDDGTIVCCFSRKKSRNDCLIWAEVIGAKGSAIRAFLQGGFPFRGHPERKRGTSQITSGINV